MIEISAQPPTKTGVMIGLVASAGILLLGACGGEASTSSTGSTSTADVASNASAATAMPEPSVEPMAPDSAAVPPGGSGTVDIASAESLPDAAAAAAAAAVTCDPDATPCELGNTGPGGGLVFFVDPAGFPCGEGAVCTALEGAPVGWSGEDNDPIGIWCADDQAGFDTVATDNGNYDPFTIVIGTGLVNTRMIVEGCGEATAAGVASAYAGGGLNDWYLPSIDEFMLLARPMFDTGSTKVWNGLENGRVYWTSSQSDPDFIGPNAADTGGVPMLEGNGGLGTNKKEVALVHPIRAF